MKDTKQVKLEKPNKPDRNASWWSTYYWNACLPFFIGRNAKLIHRVRYAHTHFRHGVLSHSTVTYWCGNINSISHPSELTADPPTDRLLCEGCEHRATTHDQRSADELAGRHVHKGRLIAKRSCCAEREQN